VVSGDARLLRGLGTTKLIPVWAVPNSHRTIVTHTAMTHGPDVAWQLTG
jgi:hypothetical protein